MNELSLTITRLLERYAVELPQSVNYTWDAGVPVLASLAVAASYSGNEQLADFARENMSSLCAAWLKAGPKYPSSLALYGGAGSTIMGLMMSSSHNKEIESFYIRIRTVLVEKIENLSWKNPIDDWQDYDLITGPSGLLLTLCQDPAIEWKNISSLVTHLTMLLASKQWEALRVQGCQNDSLRHWNYQAVNLGLAHGVGGILAALAQAIRRFPEESKLTISLPIDFLKSGQEVKEKSLLTILKESTEFFLKQLRLDKKGILTWPAKILPDTIKDPILPSRREAWCYGAPGLSWVVWDIGQLLNRKDIMEKGIDIFETYTKLFDGDFHLDDDLDERLAICHGVAGLLLIARSFEHHAQLDIARDIAIQWENFLLQQLNAIETLAKRNASLLSGGAGVLSALLSHQIKDRRWLSALALR